MLIAVFSDIHGNLHALEAVLNDVRTQAPDRVYCLGDLVGYGAFPNEVIAAIGRERIPTVLGNYDEGVGFERETCGCAYTDVESRRLGDLSFAWTKARVTSENKEFLRSLPTEIRFEAEGKQVLLVHGSPRKINEYLFEDRPAATFERIAAVAGASVVIIGHTHLTYTKMSGKIAFVNCGSVGKQKDGDTRARYALIDIVADGVHVDFRPVPYDVAAAASAARLSGLPDHYAVSLESGRC